MPRTGTDPYRRGPLVFNGEETRLINGVVEYGVYRVTQRTLITLLDSELFEYLSVVC